ncbi:hypothetical protein Y032_1277g3799 [Ancylostoma ceylanicum]|uniref:Uncharacterized protein n=1 Tax=Ancylostoma ceylanicum TaxID=53326 RepID=A0A016W4Z2_9BILA|nr:hypothetical protein Y032_1277g3799 [Ancylostoma ceylanicum]
MEKAAQPSRNRRRVYSGTFRGPPAHSSLSYRERILGDRGHSRWDVDHHVQFLTPISTPYPKFPAGFCLANYTYFFSLRCNTVLLYGLQAKPGSCIIVLRILRASRENKGLASVLQMRQP